MRILVAPQEFKGTLTATEAAEAIAAGLRAFDPLWDVRLLPMADGGPGTVDALLTGGGGKKEHTPALDPLMRPVMAEWARLPNGAAVLECASASGLWRLHANEFNVLRASSFGTGQVIATALKAGCREVYVGLGGSATNDGGAGMAEALGFRLLDDRGNELAPGGAALINLRHIDPGSANPAIKETRFLGATDVNNPLCGPLGASYVFGPQKGADDDMVEQLDDALSHFATIVRSDLGLDVRDIPGAGAAGGLGAGLIAFLGATILPGAEWVSQAAGLAEQIRDSAIVVTGEGRLDAQSSFGKGPAYIAEQAKKAGKPCLCIAGIPGEGSEQAEALFDVVEFSSSVGALLPSKDEARLQLTEAAKRAASRIAGFVVSS